MRIAFNLGAETDSSGCHLSALAKNSKSNVMAGRIRLVKLGGIQCGLCGTAE